MLQRRARPRPHLQRRVHGAQPVGGAVALRRRPHHARRPRHDDPVVVAQHDRRRRPADGRDRRPAGWARRAAAGHPARRRSRPVVEWVKSRHPVYETPITLTPQHTVGDALGLIHKRAHGAVIVVDDDGRPVGIFTEHDAAGFDRFTQLQHVMSSELVTRRRRRRPGEGVRAADAERVARSRRSSTPTGGCSAASRARARCARRSTARPSTPTAGCWSPSRSASTAIPVDQAPRRSPRWASTCSSSTPPTATRPRMLEVVEAGARGVPGHADRRRQRRHRRRHARAHRGRRRHRQGRRRARRDVHDADDDRRRPAAVLGGGRVRRRGRAGSASTSGPTAACATRATSRWRWPAGRPA